MVEILYEDNHLLFANKPNNLLTQPSGTKQPSLEEELKAFIKERDKKPGNVFLHAVHRLDKGASGVVLFAKSQKGLSRMAQAVREGKVKKIYGALVEGALEEKQGTLEHHLLHGDHRAVVDPQGKKAVLHYQVVKEVEDTSLVRVELVTGRYHQIRVQMAAIGHPLLGDQKYGSSRPFEGIALHHQSMTVPHPITGELLTVEAPPI